MFQKLEDKAVLALNTSFAASLGRKFSIEKQKLLTSSSSTWQCPVAYNEFYNQSSSLYRENMKALGA